MVALQTDYFDLGQICRSGQCFRMRRIEGENKGTGAENIRLDAGAGHGDSKTGLGWETYEIIAAQRYLRASQRGREFRFFCCQEEFEDFWKAYFDLDNDYKAYIDQINPRDTYLLAAADSGSGIRILRQDLWEMIVSFLISQQNNIVRIRRCIGNICERYGERKVAPEGWEYYGFPKAETLAELDEGALMECNLGYRGKYVVRTARSVASGETDLERIRKLPYRKAKEELLKLFGVGEKVADCICLFALHDLEAFPVDTHINQALEAHYKRGFPKRRYRGFQGVLQQYIFCHELHSGS